MDKQLDVGRVRRTRRSNNVAILLLAFGGATSLEEVEPFLKNVLAPRPVSNEQVKHAKKRYAAIGGKSPLLDITKRQASLLERVINETTPHPTSPLRGEEKIKVYIGMRHWHPFIKETLAQMANDGISKVTAISMAPQNSPASTGGYVSAVNKAIKKINRHPEQSAVPADRQEGSQIDVNFMESWHNKKDFAELLAKRIEQKLSEFYERNNVHVIFSAHSLPLKSIENDPYVEQLQQTIQEVFKITGLLEHTLAYQSKGGGDIEWLGPGVEKVLEDLARENTKNVLLVPIGFVSDHIETRYDIDIVFKERADSLGLNFKRTPSLNDSLDFINFLAELISQKLGETS